MKIDWTTTLELWCAKSSFKKHLILEKREHFRNGQNWPRCMDYSPCKIVSLGQNLKTEKRCEKRLCDHIRVVVFRNRSRKHLIFEKGEHFENDQNWPRRKGYSPCRIVNCGLMFNVQRIHEKEFCNFLKAMAFGKYSLW